MTLNLCVLTPNRIVWDSEVNEIILSTNSGQIGVLSNHAPIATAVDIGILRIRLCRRIDKRVSLSGWLDQNKKFSKTHYSIGRPIKS